jgi:hypothetical protein
MAPSRFPIELTKQESVVVDLQSARAYYFWNAYQIPLWSDLIIPRFGKIMKAVYMSVSQVSFDKRFEKRILSCWDWLCRLHARNLSSRRRK